MNTPAVRETFRTGQHVDYSAVCETMLQDIVLHDQVVAVSVYADDRIP